MNKYFLVILISLLLANNSMASDKKCLNLINLYQTSITAISNNSLLTQKGFEDISITAEKDWHLERMENALDKYFLKNKPHFCLTFSEILGVGDSYDIPNKNIKYSEIFNPDFRWNMVKYASTQLKKSWWTSYKKRLGEFYNKKDVYTYIHGCEVSGDVLYNFLGKPEHLGVGSKLFRTARDVFHRCLKNSRDKINEDKGGKSSFDDF